MKKFVSIILLILSISNFSFSGVMGAIKGVVKDKKTGKPIAEVKVTIKSIKIKNLNYTLSTDKKGYFYKTGLQPGMYVLTFEKEGYIPFRKMERVPISETVNVSILLEKLSLAANGKSKIKEALSYFEKKDYKKAYEAFLKISEEAPDNPVYYFYLGLSSERLGKIEDAIKYYEESLKLKENFAFSLQKLGTLYARKGDFGKAMEYYKRAINSGGGDANTYYNFGICAINMGNNDIAKNAMEKVLEIDPNYSDAYYQLGLVYLGLGNMSKAKEMLERFIKIDPENPNVQTAKEILKSLK